MVRIYMHYAESQIHTQVMCVDFSHELNQAIVKVAPHLRQIEVSAEELIFQEQIGAGSSAQVFKGKYMNTMVAIKQCLIVDLLDDPLKELMAETTLMSSLRHPNVVQFVGASLKPPYFYIISEFCENGSLDRVAHHENTRCVEIRKELNTISKLKMMYDCVLGMVYLSKQKPPIIHRDLKLANLLVDKNWRVKVADFGVSKLLKDAQPKQMTRGMLVVNWEG